MTWLAACQNSIHLS